VFSDFGIGQPMNAALCYGSPYSGWDSLQLEMHTKASHFHHPAIKKHSFISNLYLKKSTKSCCFYYFQICFLCPALRGRVSDDKWRHLESFIWKGLSGRACSAVTVVISGLATDKSMCVCRQGLHLFCPWCGNISLDVSPHAPPITVSCTKFSIRLVKEK
jgi:hypothetical protein